ncbi:MAG TPA: HD domain-containing phosphohydrolase [Candidatus Dormibacteraeota bacterium]
MPPARHENTTAQRVVAAAPATPRTRLSELIAAQSLTTDLAFAQPMEHVLRACLIALRVGERLGVDEQTRADAYWVTLLATVCTGESFEMVKLFGDDIAFRSGMYHVGPSQFAVMFYALGQAGAGRSPLSRAGTAARIVGSAGHSVESIFIAHCAVTTAVSRRFRLDPGVTQALPNTFARWDGKGIPRRVGGGDIPMPIHLMHLADMAEVHNSRGGLEAAITVAREHSGKLLAPDVVHAFCESAPEVLTDLDDPWERVVAAEPSTRGPLSESEVDEVLEVIADIADLKSPWFAGHSRGVSALASRAVAAAGMPAADITTVRRAGLLHDLGRTAVANSVWDKPGPLTDGEQERVRLHAYYTERMLRRPALLAGLSAIAASHHERLDGSGYHRAVRGAEIPLLGRYLAAADVFHAVQEERPYRPAMSERQAVRHMRTQVHDGKLDHAAVEAVLGVAGHRAATTVAAPAGLTPREVEVLVLIARGATTQQVSRLLNITPKTAGNHIERIYSKIGASSRSTATLFAMQHGMLATLEPIEG